MSDYTIRRATLDDVEEMVRLRHDMQAEMGQHRGAVDADAIVDATREYFQKQLTGAHFTGFLAEAGGRIIGTGSFVVYDTPPSTANPSGTDAYVLNMYTIPEYRGRGIARDILKALLDRAYEEGARRIWLRTSARARPVYEHLGFESRDNYMQRFL
jgi:ribosomal protein S18 acetylase RimI-like enzyme